MNPPGRAMVPVPLAPVHLDDEVSNIDLGQDQIAIKAGFLGLLRSKGNDAAVASSATMVNAAIATA